MRTTLNLDDSVLRELKERGRREGRPLGVIASELLARALAADVPPAPAPLVWRSQPMGTKVDLDDPDAVQAAMDEYQS